MDNEAQGTINRRVAMHIKRRVSGWLTLAVLAVGGAMVAADPAFAKVDMDNLTIGGEARIRYEGRINTALNSNVVANESAASHRIRVNVGYDLTPDVSFFAQIQDARIWGTEGPFGTSAAANAGIGAVSAQNQQGSGVDLHQGFILVKNLFAPGLSLKAGRQEIIYGDHRLFGNFNWSQVGNSFDAVKLMYSTPTVDVDVFWARIFDNENGGGCTRSTFGAGTTPASGANCSGVIFPGAGKDDAAAVRTGGWSRTSTKCRSSTSATIFIVKYPRPEDVHIHRRGGIHELDGVKGVPDLAPVEVAEEPVVAVDDLLAAGLEAEARSKEILDQDKALVQVHTAALLVLG